jgi:hypothetical protein
MASPHLSFTRKNIYLNFKDDNYNPVIHDQQDVKKLAIFSHNQVRRKNDFKKTNGYSKNHNKRRKIEKMQEDKER